MENSEVPIDKLVRAYRNVRTEIQELTKTYETTLEGLEQVKNEISGELKDRMLKMGGKSLNTASGTVILGTKTRYTTQDWDSFKQFVLEHEAVELLERRIAQGNMKQFLEENPGVVPPGLNSDSEYTITVRKPSK
jgi:hypothetical protein